MVYFVGAGTGAADLITVRGMWLLEQADVIIYAGSLVNPELLAYAKKECEIFNSATMTLSEVLAVMQQSQEAGKMLVRLHTGDPSIYGAIREQMDELDRLGIPYESCPGVSACFGAAGILKYRVYAAGNFTVFDHYADGRQNEGSNEREYRKFCGASGIHGNLFKHRHVRGIKPKTDRRRI